MDLTPVVRDRAEKRLRNRFMRPLLTIVVKPGLSITQEIRPTSGDVYLILVTRRNGNGRPADAGRPSLEGKTAVYL
jgi:hypothetical protein